MPPTTKEQEKLKLHPDLRAEDSYPPSADLVRSCDLVMKGGISSGVVYPLAICQLATDHKICSVGGTSAGAIAAGAAAAAEYGRDAGGYARLAELPAWLSANPDDSTHTNLYELFQAQKQTVPLYRFVSVLIQGHKGWRRLVRLVVPGLGLFRPQIGPLMTLGVPLALLAGAAIAGSLVGIVASAVLLLVGLVLAVILSAWGRFKHDLAKNRFGMCSGMPGHESTHPALTPWLTDTFNSLAGKPVKGAPLTFGDLGEHDVELAMLTTNLSTGSQARLPFSQRIWAFDPEEFKALFPNEVVEWMVENRAKPRGTTSQQNSDSKIFDRFEAAGLCPLPDPAKLPVIVGVRMSLSFPVLLSGVPLHAIDYKKPGHPIERHWFSDGGATSNFPLHFFDCAVPGRPTFAIDLATVDHVSASEADNVSMPRGNASGILAKHDEIATSTQFVAALLKAIQSWADNMQTHMPGYRDRIATVTHTSEEGGLNLDMDPQTVARLSERGQYAGAMAQQRFDLENHRWVRYRSFIHVLEAFVRGAADNYREQTTSRPYAALAADPPSYTDWPQSDGALLTESILNLADQFAEVEARRNRTFAAGAPSPSPTLQARPDA